MGQLLRCFGTALFLLIGVLLLRSGVAANELPVGVGNADPTLSLGLNGFNDYSTEFPFLDLMKQAAPWFAFAPNAWASMQYPALDAGAYLDQNGWPTEIPEGMAGIRTNWALPQGIHPGSGNYVLTYEGEGTIRMAGGVTSSQPGRIEFSATGAFWMDITSTDPNGTGDYIKNIRIVPAEYEALADVGEIFNPDFLAIVDDARQLRFMDWMQTNGSTQSEWADRPQVGDAMWTKTGVPLEIMVALANKVGAEPWFNMPHMATDEYVEQFATYVRDHLDPGLAANVEYSNETWNFGFGQYTWLAAQAQAEWGIAPGGDAWIQYSAKRATEAALIWDEVFGAQAEARVYNVIGVQTGWQGLAESQLNAGLWAQKDPANFVAPNTVFDAIGITNYFGGSHISNATLRAELLAQINTHPSDIETVYDWLASRLIAGDMDWSVPHLQQVWGQFRAMADANGMDLVAYEGGSHEHHSAFTNVSEADLAKLTQFYIGFSYSEQIAEVYQAVWDAWAAVSDGPFMQFGDVANPNKYGSWGILRFLGDTNPRASALFDLNANSDSWFGDGGGTRYQQGVIKLATSDTGETLTGTDKDDVLVGGDGNDTFIPGLGNDRINGGKGNDTIRLHSEINYSIRKNGAVAIVTLLDQQISLLNIEILELKDGSTVSLAGTQAISRGLE